MNKNCLKNNILKNIELMKYNSYINRNNNPKNLYSQYNQEYNRKIALLKNLPNFNQNQNLQKKSQIYNITKVVNFANYKRLTQYELGNRENKLFFETSYNGNTDNFNMKEKYQNSLKVPKNKRLFSSEDLLYTNNANNPEMRVLINNGIIKNMYIDNKIKKYYSNINYNYTQNSNNDNSNDINDSLYNSKYQNSKLFNSFYKSKKAEIYNNSNYNIYNLTQTNFKNNNNNYINKYTINNYIYKNQDKHPNKICIKKSSEKFIINSNSKPRNNMNIKKDNNNQNINQNYIIKKNIIIPDFINKRHLYSKSNICNNNNNFEDLSLNSIPKQYMKKYSYEQKKEKKNNNIMNLKQNLMNKNLNYNKLINNENNINNNNLNKKKNNNNSNKLISSSSSEELSLLAEDIINKFHKNTRIKTPLKSENKSNYYNNDLIKIEKKNLIANAKHNPSIKYIQNIKNKEIKCLMIPVNINNYMNRSYNNFKNKNNNVFNNFKSNQKNINKNKKQFPSISKNNLKTELKKKEININNKNNNKIISFNNDNNNIFDQKKEKINELNDENINKIKNKENKINKRKESESNNEDLTLIEQIMSDVENQEKSKKNRHIYFNLNNNIYIHYNTKDLIIKQNIIYKGEKKIEINNNNNEKKMDVYYALLKSKTKFNSIIKNFNKNDIKINNEYELNENLEEYEILGDLYNIFYSKNINDLDNKLKKTIDIFMKDKK